MKDLQHKSYFNRRNYILDNLDNLNLTCDEALFILILDFLNEQGIIINYQIIAQKMHIKENEVEKLVKSLSEKNYLDLSFENYSVQYNIDKVFDENTQSHDKEVTSDLFQLLEDALSRPLNNTEAVRLRDLMSQYDAINIEKAIKKAVIYEKVNIDYIAAILKDNG